MSTYMKIASIHRQCGSQVVYSDLTGMVGLIRSTE